MSQHRQGWELVVDEHFEESKETDCLLFQGEDAIEEAFEILSKNIQNLQTCAQNITSFIEIIGKEDDSVIMRKQLHQLKNNAHTLSKTVHTQVTELNNTIKKAKNNTTTEINLRRQAIHRKLSNDYDRLLREIQGLFNTIRDREKTYPSNSIPNNSPEEEKGSVQAQLLDDFSEFDEMHDEDEIAAVEQDLKELVDIFEALSDSVILQEQKLQTAIQDVQKANEATSEGVENLQTVNRWHTMGVVGMTVGGAVLGGLLGGPVGFFVATKTAFSLSTAIASTAAVGVGVGAVGGLITQKLKTGTVSQPEQDKAKDQ